MELVREGWSWLGWKGGWVVFWRRCKNGGRASLICQVRGSDAGLRELNKKVFACPLLFTVWDSMRGT